MQTKYLGEKPVKIKDTPFKDYNSTDWVLYYIEHYGQIDGEHHKQWVLDQVVRIIKRTPLVITLAKWSNGEEEYRVKTGDPSEGYKLWVKDMLGKWDEEDEEYEYEYDEGISP